MGKLSEMPGFLVATRLQNLCGEPNQLAKVLRDKDGKEAQIPGTKNALWAGIFRHPRLDLISKDRAGANPCNHL